jgi:hypothetical protein
MIFRSVRGSSLEANGVCAFVLANKLGDGDLKRHIAFSNQKGGVGKAKLTR